MSKQTIEIQGQAVRVKQTESTWYICLTDIEKISGDNLVRDWLRNLSTLDFLEAWERKRQTNFNLEEWQQMKATTPFTKINMSATKWQGLGGEAIIMKRGRFGGTFGDIAVAIHFANWLNPDYYLDLIDNYTALRYGNLDLKYIEWMLNKIDNNTLESNRLTQEIQQQIKSLK